MTCFFFFSSRRRHTRCALVTGVQTCALPILPSAAGRIDAYYDTNFLIHEAVQTLADNRWLSDMVGNLRKVLSLFRHKSLTVPGRIAESCAEHLAIFAALKARDPDAAEALARKHLLRQLDALRLLASQAETPASATSSPTQEP